jgi:hypothetical protein
LALGVGSRVYGSGTLRGHKMEEIKPILDQLNELWKAAERELAALLVPDLVQVNTEHGVLVWNKRRIGLLAPVGPPGVTRDGIKFISDCAVLQKIALAAHYPALKKAIIERRQQLMKDTGDAVMVMLKEVGKA